MAKKPSPPKVPGVRYGTSGFGPYQDEMNAVESRRQARDAEIRKRTPTVRATSPKSSIVADTIAAVENARTKKARTRGEEELAISSRVAERGRGYVNARYGISDTASKPKPKPKGR